jgi:regulator of protease activity HflC (stomatin/prohibitin superfamily)
MGLTIITALIAVLAIAFALRGIKIVQQSETVIVERLGKYHSTLTSGLNIIIPFLDRPRQIIWRYSTEGAMGNTIVKYVKENRIDLRETVYDFPKQNVITKDNIVTEINALIYFQVMDPVRAVYEIANLPQAIEKLTQTSLRNVIGEMDLDDTLSSRDTINSKLQEILDDATNKWGVKVNRVELQDINPPMDIREAMEKQMRAERDKRATILEAEGNKQSQVLEAEGERQADSTRAEGEAQARIAVAQAEAEAIKVVTEAVQNTGDPVNYLVAMKYLETLKEMTSGQDNKVVYIPYEATGVLSSVGGIKDLLVTKGVQ